MKILEYYNNSEQKEKSEKETDESIMKRELISLLKMSLKTNDIDIIEYSFCLDFVKKKGNIINFYEFNEIIDKINEEDVLKICHKLYKNFYKLFKNVEIKEENLCIDSLINDINNGNGVKTLTYDQVIGLKELYKFLLDRNSNTYGLYGYAGTGKTTLITMFVNYILSKRYIKKIALSAPTNKAVNIMKSKFMSYSTEEQDVDFLTIHKLLNLKNDIDVNGERMFIKGSSMLNRYDLIIVDECSMISFDIMRHIFGNIKKTKIMFIGDPAQLPPVNEKVSIVFSTNIDDFKLYNKMYDEHSVTEVTNMILKQKTWTLQKIVRSNDTNIINLCNSIRDWISEKINYPKIGLYKGKNVCLYKKHDKFGYDKIKTEWFKKCLKYFNSKENVIILTWTNKQSDIYNTEVRKVLLNKIKLERFEIGDILIFRDYYSIKSDNDKEVKRFYSSDQIRIIDINKVTKVCSYFNEQLSRKFKNPDIEERYKRTIKSINKFKRNQETWKLSVKEKDTNLDIIYDIYVIDNIKYLEEIKTDISDKIKDLRQQYKTFHKEKINILEDSLIRKLWKQFNKTFNEPFAEINYGTAITVHKSQGSTFKHVFVDAHDILMNKNNNEAKRCIYTALTRVSDELHILV
jgi:exodeoxyribonuclease-5